MHARGIVHVWLRLRLGRRCFGRRLHRQLRVSEGGSLQLQQGSQHRHPIAHLDPLALLLVPLLPRPRLAPAAAVPHRLALGALR